MKTTALLTLIMATVLSFTTLANAENIPAEVSAVILAPGYSQILRKQLALAKQSGKTLRATAYDVVVIGDATIVSFKLATKFSADFGETWTEAGSLIAHISYGPLGEIVIDGLYFKPAEDIPGGASVGNN